MEVGRGPKESQRKKKSSDAVKRPLLVVNYTYKLKNVWIMEKNIFTAFVRNVVCLIIREIMQKGI
jgi:hypothetical protein